MFNSIRKVVSHNSGFIRVYYIADDLFFIDEGVNVPNFNRVISSSLFMELLC